MNIIVLQDLSTDFKKIVKRLEVRRGWSSLHASRIVFLSSGRKLEVWNKRSSIALYVQHPSHHFTSSNLLTPYQADDYKWRIIPCGTLPRGDVVVSDCVSIYWICFFNKPLNHLTVLISCQRKEQHFLPMRMSHCQQEREETSTRYPSVSPSVVACAALQCTLCHSGDF